jgi:hypothetical protein
MYVELFKIVNQFVLIGWLLLLFAPKWKYSENIAVWICVLMLCGLYSILILLELPNFDLGSFSSLEGIRKLFTKDQALLAGWIHYLAFDLFVGVYILKQTKKLKIPHVMNFIFLPITFLFGPLGYLMFMLIKFYRLKHEIHQ